MGDFVPRVEITGTRVGDEGSTMGQVIANASMSLDGYIAKPDNTIGRPFDWLQNGEVEFRTVDPELTFHLSPPSAGCLAPGSVETLE